MDIVKRLRALSKTAVAPSLTPSMEEAADEIERLRADLDAADMWVEAAERSMSIERRLSSSALQCAFRQNAEIERLRATNAPS
uniref:Uncharacterized protein n=1 Tax=viral metagenome TaxID=1070528 RepID=A0A6M3LF58_9ZZZZ